MEYNLIKSLIVECMDNKPTIKETSIKLWNNGFDLANIAEYIQTSYKDIDFTDIDVIKMVVSIIKPPTNIKEYICLNKNCGDQCKISIDGKYNLPVESYDDKFECLLFSGELKTKFQLI